MVDNISVLEFFCLVNRSIYVTEMGSSRRPVVAMSRKWEITDNPEVLLLEQDHYLGHFGILKDWI